MKEGKRETRGGFDQGFDPVFLFILGLGQIYCWASVCVFGLRDCEGLGGGKR